MNRLTLTPLIFMFLFSISCASTPLDSYPWVAESEQCETIIIRPGRIEPFTYDSPCVVGKGVVKTTDGNPILESHVVRVRFSSGRGSILIDGYGPDFQITLGPQDIRKAHLYYWNATVLLSKDGPVIYQTSDPQPFNIEVPIVVLVEPVGKSSK